VPSQISFKRAPNGEKQWGFNIAESAVVFKWTKLELMPRNAASELETLQKLLEAQTLLNQVRSGGETGKQLTRTAQDIITDFLTKLGREWLFWMREQGVNTLQEVPLDIVVTHPVVSL